MDRNNRTVLQQRTQELQAARQQRIQELQAARQERTQELQATRQERTQELQVARQERTQELQAARQERTQELRAARQERTQDAQEARQRLIHDGSNFKALRDLDETQHRLKFVQTHEETESETVAIQSPRQRQLNVRCRSVLLACEWVQSLNWPPSLFNSAFDHCYCEHCYPPHWNDIEHVAGCKYVIPRGWVRIGLHVDQSFAEIHQIWSKWIVCYHGTSTMAALSILSHHHFYLPGDMLMDGTVLGIRPGHIPGKKYIYTSPTIAYSSLSAYSPTYSFHSRKTRKDYHVQLVLQCRQNPGTFHVQAETVRSGDQRICPYIPNNIIEHYTEIRSSIVAYGLLVRMTEQDDY